MEHGVGGKSPASTGIENTHSSCNIYGRDLALDSCAVWSTLPRWCSTMRAMAAVTAEETIPEIYSAVRTGAVPRGRASAGLSR